MIVVDLRHVGMTAWLSEVLKISVRTFVSCSAQSFNTRPGMLSGPTALHGLILGGSSLRRLETDRVPGCLEVWAVFVQVCHSAFQTENKSGWVHLGGMCRHHRPVAGACSQWWSKWLATGSVSLYWLWSDHWFVEHMTVSHFLCHRTDWLFTRVLRIRNATCMAHHLSATYVEFSVRLLNV